MTKNNRLWTKKEVKLVPCYYEWHLVDEKGNILLNIIDSQVDDLEEKEIVGGGLDDFLLLIDDIYIEACQAHGNHEEYNGVDMTEIELEPGWMYVVAITLCSLKRNREILEKVVRFRDLVLHEEEIQVPDLSPMDWHTMYECAKRA